MEACQGAVSLDAIAQTLEGISPHSLRNFCAAHLLECGAEIRYVQELLGHEPVDTSGYTRRVVAVLKRVHKQHHAPEDRNVSTRGIDGWRGKPLYYRRGATHECETQPRTRPAEVTY